MLNPSSRTPGHSARSARAEEHHMPKDPNERIDLLEKKVNTYRVLVTLLVVLLVIVQRRTIVGWIDSAESWMSNVAQTRAS